MGRNFFNAGIITLATAVLLIGGYEWYLRTQGYEISYDDFGPLFANSKRDIYLSQNEATVFIGSSRIKYDIDHEAWQQRTGEKVVQLANVGSSPLPLLDALSADENFKGKLIVDATDGLFFQASPPNLKRPREYLEYAAKETPAQRFSFHVNRILEKFFVFLEKDNFALNALIDKLPVPNRPGVKSFPPYPVEFERVSFSRQSRMSENFVKTDSVGINQMRNVWVRMGEGRLKAPKMSEKAIDSLVSRVDSLVQKITNRGGKVIFVRPPSSGPLWEIECQLFPKAKFWEVLIEKTNCNGIHFDEYSTINQYDCTEYSHLQLSDARHYTHALLDIIQSQNLWKQNPIQ